MAFGSPQIYPSYIAGIHVGKARGWVDHTTARRSSSKCPWSWMLLLTKELCAGPRNAHMSIFTTMSNLEWNWSTTVTLYNSLVCRSAWHEVVYWSSGTQLLSYSCCRSVFWCEQNTFHFDVSLNTLMQIFCKTATLHPQHCQDHWRFPLSRPLEEEELLFSWFCIMW